MRLDRLEGWFRSRLGEEGLKAATIRCKMSYISPFITFLMARRICDTKAITRETIGDYCEALHGAVSERTGKPLRSLTIRGRVSAVRILMTQLYDAGIINRLTLPPSSVHALEKPLVTVFDEGEVASFLESIKADSPQGLRDRALFELIYGSGLRAGEVGRLRWDDVNLDARRAVVRQSKFDKDRVVPLTHETVEMLRRFRVQERLPSLLVFPGKKGQGLTPSYINKRFKALCAKAGLYRSGVTTHQLRHACATHLISHGANIRYVQDLLGHESIQTTVRYTRQMVDEVQKAYRQYHPRENMLYEVVASGYEQRVGELEKRILEARKRTLAKKSKRMIH